MTPSAPGPPFFEGAAAFSDVLRWRASAHPNDLYVTYLADDERPEAELTFGALHARAEAIAALVRQEGKLLAISCAARARGARAAGTVQHDWHRRRRTLAHLHRRIADWLLQAALRTLIRTLPPLRSYPLRL